MLSVAESCEDLARYVAASLWMADRACEALQDEGRPLDYSSLRASLRTPRSALENALSADYRFRRLDDGKWALQLWEKQEQAVRSPILAVIKRFLYWRG